MLVTFHNLLTAMIKSLWSLKVIRGSERHLVNKENSCHLFSEWHWSFECTHLPLWVTHSGECMTNTREVFSKRHYGGNDDSSQLRIAGGASWPEIILQTAGDSFVVPRLWIQVHIHGCLGCCWKHILFLYHNNEWAVNCLKKYNTIQPDTTWQAAS